MSKRKKNYFEQAEGGEVISVEVRNKAKGENKI